MSPEELETLRAAVRVKYDLPADLMALKRGLPKRHAVEWPASQAADFVLRQFAGAESETQFVKRRGDGPPTTDIFREDSP